MKSFLPSHILLLVLGVLFISAYPMRCYAQDDATVMGQVINLVTKQPVSNVIIVFKSDNSIETTYITDDSGYYYARNLAAGLYRIEYLYEGVNGIFDSNFKLTAQTQHWINFSFIDSTPRKITGCPFYQEYPQINLTSKTGSEISIYSSNGVCGYPIDYAVIEVSSEELIPLKNDEGQEPIIFYIDGLPYKSPYMLASINCETFDYYKGSVPAKFNDASSISINLGSRIFSPVGIKQSIP